MPVEPHKIAAPLSFSMWLATPCLVPGHSCNLDTSSPFHGILVFGSDLAPGMAVCSISSAKTNCWNHDLSGWQNGQKISKNDKKDQTNTLSIVLGVFHPAPLKFPQICVVTMVFLKRLLGDVFSELHIGGISKPGRYLEFGLRFPTKKHITNEVKHASLRHWKLDPYQSTILFCIPLSSSFQIYEWTNGSSLTTCNLEKKTNIPTNKEPAIWQYFNSSPALQRDISHLNMHSLTSPNPLKHEAIKDFP